jgi:hypothetical protein
MKNAVFFTRHYIPEDCILLVLFSFIAIAEIDAIAVNLWTLQVKRHCRWNGGSVLIIVELRIFQFKRNDHIETFQVNNILLSLFN